MYRQVKSSWKIFYASYIQKSKRKDILLIFARLIATIFSLLFSIYYSTSLGLERKSILVFIMSMCLLLNLILNSGVSFYFRDTYEKSNEADIYSNFIASMGLSLIPTLVFLVIGFRFYEKYQVEMATNLELAGLIYGISANLNMAAIDILFALKKVRLLIFIEITTILNQITMYFMLKNFIKLSQIVAVLVAFSMSYYFNFLIISKSVKFSMNILTLKNFKNVFKFYKESRNHQSVGLITTFLDRADKVLIGLVLPGAELSRFSTSSNLLIMFRFIPDTAIKLRVSGVVDYRKFFANRVITVLVFSGSLLIIPFTFHNLINATYGSDWNLPITILSLLIIQEIARFFFNFRIVSDFKQYKKLNEYRLFSILLISSLILIFSLHKWGIIAAPIGITVTYVSLYLLAKSKVPR